MQQETKISKNIIKDKIIINSILANKHAAKAKFYEIIEKSHNLGVSFDDLDNILHKYKLNKNLKIKNNKSTQTKNIFKKNEKYCDVF